ncbi:hypothetical protein [Escherichia phage phiWec190]|nr:hypothetical protein [Escherichia phage phiWec188]BDU13850.1 hypothetical protein [Escherichia phage phiWec190]
MSIVRMLQAIKLAELSDLKVEITEYDYGDLSVHIFPLPVDGAYAWCYADNFPPDDTKGVTDFILKSIVENSQRN